MCSETKQKFVRDIIAVVFFSSEENNCKLRNCRWKFQKTANVVFATGKVWRIIFAFAPHDNSDLDEKVLPLLYIYSYSGKGHRFIFNPCWQFMADP